MLPPRQAGRAVGLAAAGARAAAGADRVRVLRAAPAALRAEVTQALGG